MQASYYLVLLYLILCFFFLQAADVGGSIAIHAYGAYFGLGVSLAYKAKKSTTVAETDLATQAPVSFLNGPSYTSDVTAMIGKLNRNIKIVQVVYLLLNVVHLMVQARNTLVSSQNRTRIKFPSRFGTCQIGRPMRPNIIKCFGYILNLSNTNLSPTLS